MSVLRKEADGRWRIARDANLGHAGVGREFGATDQRRRMTIDE